MERLPDYPFEPHYLEVSGYRMHYLDEGPVDGPVFMLLHGVPSWSFIYRRIIPKLVSKGFRVVCPDLIGFGKSQKIHKSKIHSYELHLDSLTRLLTQSDMKEVMIYGQDWGANFALHLCITKPDRIIGVIVSNGSVLTGHEPLPFHLKAWKWFAQRSPILPVGTLLNMGCQRKLTKAERKAYDFPFTGKKDQTGIREFPAWIPSHSNDEHAIRGQNIWQKLSVLKTPTLCLFSNNDPFTRGAEIYIIEKIPGANNQSHRTLSGGHFIQEDAGEEIANLLIEFAKQFSP